ncbi:Uncharacterised protein [Alloiococcus otitis]|uniref:N-acetyltransferase domain-containing protein n=1 Tax=Alloiococcus otitis ATCC 51267 TaxID=883081 RepID=K9EAG6_9LACT|nr:GNAT family N-acetyltransferase [Alloiococcus otitis]EKU94234.1 hypothetical protein HMPREF9698_00266 [Alloiococcus otitis ATCC 51267]SUU81132.1 Uncharacterised protein [Alloiococcus otitis]
MLTAFKSDYEKIAMGLLSYIDDLKVTSRLKEEMDLYTDEDNRQLFLWKSDETDDFCGVIGIEENDDLILVRHIAVNPSYRNEGIAYQMIDAVAEKYDVQTMMSTLETSDLVTKWQKKKNAESDAESEGEAGLDQEKLDD